MEKNTVMVDLDRYEELLLSEQDFRNQLIALQDTVNSRFLISKDSFRIKREGEELKLVIETKILEEIVKNIDGYTVDPVYHREMSISSYNLKIIELEE